MQELTAPTVYLVSNSRDYYYCFILFFFFLHAHINTPMLSQFLQCCRFECLYTFVYLNRLTVTRNTLKHSKHFRQLFSPSARPTEERQLVSTSIKLVIFFSPQIQGSGTSQTIEHGTSSTILNKINLF